MNWLTRLFFVAAYVVLAVIGWLWDRRYPILMVGTALLTVAGVAVGTWQAWKHWGAWLGLLSLLVLGFVGAAVIVALGVLDAIRRLSGTTP